MRAAAVLLIALFAALCSCRAPRVVNTTTTEIRRDTVLINRIHTDSLIIRDSVTVTTEGQPVYRERSVYRDRLRIDTCYIARTDTIAATHREVVEVTRTPKWCKWLLMLLAAALAAATAWGIIRKAK